MAERPGESDAPAPQAASPREGGGGLPGRLIGTGARAGRAVAGATRIDRTVETVVEEAIVRAFESAPVERAVARILDGPATQQAVERALESPAVSQAVERALDSDAVERAVRNALDSELVDRVWEQVLDSDEVQKLIKRIAEAPEVRSALSSQGVGFVEDIFRRVRDVAATVDSVLERFFRRVTRRALRATPSKRPGFFTRALALGLDALILQALFLVGASIFGWIRTSILGLDGGIGPIEFGIGSALTVLGVITYFLTFWSLAGQTPGMRLLGLRIEVDQSPYLGLRRSVRRLVGFVVALLPLGLGFLPVFFSDRRRGLHDKIAGTEVDYIDPDFSLRLLTAEEDDEFHRARAQREAAHGSAGRHHESRTEDGEETAGAGGSGGDGEEDGATPGRAESGAKDPLRNGDAPAREARAIPEAARRDDEGPKVFGR